MATGQPQLDWSEGYVHDLAYTDNFYAELAPAHLNYVAVLSGYRPRALDRPFTYCELGCGNGQTVTVLAAANPNGRFFACDINPTHVQTGRRWAEAGKVDNLTVLEASFAQMLTADVPEFDFIALHGVYSWVGGLARRAIVEFMQRKLKPGGIVYVSYNCLPGWSTVAPLQRLMTEIGPPDSMDTSARVGASVDFLKQLRDLKIAYFAANPAAPKFVDRIAGQPRGYLAHEYFNRSWMLFYSTDVVREMHAAKLTYAGSATLMENHRNLLMTSDASALVAKQPTRDRQELLKDFIINQRFRRDVFVKSTPNLPPTEAVREIDQLAVGATRAVQDIVYQVKSPLGEIKFEAPVARAVAASLADGATTVGDLAGRAELKSFPKPEVIKAAHTLLAAGQVAIFATAERRPPVPPGARRFNLPSPLNKALVAAAWDSPERSTLASPIAGTGVAAGMVERGLLAAVVEHGMDRAFDVAAAEVERRNLTFSRDGKKLEGRDANRAELRQRFDRFAEKGMPLLQRLGILDVA